MIDEANFNDSKKSTPKFSEILRRPRGETELSTDSPDISFNYADSDTYDAEMAELYSYTEESEFQYGRDCFDELFKQYFNHKGPNANWSSSLSKDEKLGHAMRLVEMTEVSDKQVRFKAVQAILYMCQGNFAECETLRQHRNNVERNVAMLFNTGAFQTCVALLHMETETNTSLNKTSICMSDSFELRMLLNVLYTMLETIRMGGKNRNNKNNNNNNNNNNDNNKKKSPQKNDGGDGGDDDNDVTPHDGGGGDGEEEEDDDDGEKSGGGGGGGGGGDLDGEFESIRETLKIDLLNSDESVLALLFNLVSKFCSANYHHLPIKKILLLLWKSLLLALGGLESIFELKNAKRLSMGLPILTEDTHEVCSHMRASSPPASAADLIEQHQQVRRSNRGALKKQAMAKQICLDDPMESLPSSSSSSSAVDDSLIDSSNEPISDEENNLTPPRPASPVPAKGLPWEPKVRSKDLENFLEQTRTKFVGFSVKNDCTSLIGLPQPIHEGVAVLNQHLYISISELQVKKEEDLAKNPLSMSEGIIEETPAELLYQMLCPTLPQCMIALLKILLAAAPTSKAKTESVNIISDILPENMPSSVLHSMKLGIDVNRHKEIIVKAVSGLLIVMLKYLKLNHIYQFEYMSQHLVFANCIPLILKFFNQNVTSHICAKNNITIIDYPSCVVGEQREITAETLEAGDQQEYCWRNVFSCINLLRVLNKLTKWKHSRTMMLVVFKSAPILKRALKARQPMLQLYALKLLKIQTKYLGRQWRKSNMKTLSAIYQKVRHRLTDDWAYGNDIDARPWDFQAEESVLRAAVERFNNRRYQPPHQPDQSGSTSAIVGPATLADFTPVDNRLQSVLGCRVELSREFKENYEAWIEREVFANQIDWCRLLSDGNSL